MNMTEIRGIAKGMGLVGYSKLNKADLIRLIQKEEENIPCYGVKPADDCDQPECCWREDCLK